MILFNKIKKKPEDGAVPPTSPSRSTARGTSVNGVTPGPRPGGQQPAQSQGQGQGQGQAQAQAQVQAQAQGQPAPQSQQQPGHQGQGQSPPPGVVGGGGGGQGAFMSMNNGSAVSNLSSSNLSNNNNNNNNNSSGSTGSGNSPRNNNNMDLHQQQQYYMSQQQQQQQQQYQQQQQQPYQQQLHAPAPTSRDTDNPGMQPNPGSFGNDTALLSQGIQYQYPQNPSQQQTDGYNQGYNGVPTGHENNGAYNMDSNDHQQQQLLQQQQQYMMNQQMSNDGMGGLGGGGGGGGANHYGGNMDGSNHNNGNGNNMNMNNGAGGGGGITNSTANSSELVLPVDVRKLQDEVMSWKKSQESSQAKVNQLRQTLTQKSQENRELHTSLTQVTQDRLVLQELVHKREKEMDDLRSKYLSDVRQFRATDDDHSTIEQRVRMLQAAILQLTKAAAGDRAVNLNHDEAQLLVKKKYKFGNSQPYILNMFLEKYIMDTLLEEVFHGPPFYIGFELAKEYGAVYKWMVDNNFQDQAVRFRQQLCFLSAKAPCAQTYAAQEAARIAKGFEAKLERLYNNWAGQQKVLDLVTKAIELSLTMRSQNAEIMALVIPNESEFDAERMVPAHKSKEGGKVKVCVMPCFADTNGVVIGKAKVFCG
ncbi:hypothetical protein BGZ65_002408 [Modicella reniformis]|uniref:Uncharacterized protein n=1 Tax=Modicella reniformis TaxID=1440133 RepID=A0A9P6LTA0_9FUNG|nr:hypothetical protein BGZ65_002408 [Modicella reniformis]